MLRYIFIYLFNNYVVLAKSGRENLTGIALIYQNTVCELRMLYKLFE